MNDGLLAEEFPRDYEITQFEKVKIAAKRAKDLHNVKKTPLLESNHKPAYVALQEYNAGMIRTVYKEDDQPPVIAEETEEEE